MVLVEKRRHGLQIHFVLLFLENPLLSVGVEVET